MFANEIKCSLISQFSFALKLQQEAVPVFVSNDTFKRFLAEF